MQEDQIIKIEEEGDNLNKYINNKIDKAIRYHELGIIIEIKKKIIWIMLLRI